MDAGKTIKGLDARHSVMVGSSSGVLPAIGVWMQHDSFRCHDYFTPEQAREFAAILLRAADEADEASAPAMDLSGVLEGARLGQAGEGS